MLSLMSRVRELERENAVLSASAAALHSLLRDIISGRESAPEMSVRLSAIRGFAEELSAQGFTLNLNAGSVADVCVAKAMDRIGDHLRVLLDNPLCTCGECDTEERD